MTQQSLIPDSFEDLFRQAGHYHDCQKPTSEVLLRNMGYKAASMNAQAPIFYAGDYMLGKYLYLDPSCEIVFGFTRDYIASGGHSFYNSRIHPDDYRIFNKKIFPESIRLLQKLPSEERLNFSCSYNYRVRIKSGEWLTVLQRGTYFLHPEAGHPLASVGFIIDITHFKEDTKIIHTIERIDRDFSVLSKNPYYKAIYYPVPEKGTLTTREIEVLQAIYEGLNSRQISYKLNISENTVVNHRKNMLKKTNTKNSAELLRYAINNKLI